MNLAIHYHGHGSSGSTAALPADDLAECLSTIFENQKWPKFGLKKE